MPTPRLNSKSQLYDVRFPLEMANFLQGLAADRYDGNISNAIRYCVELAQSVATDKT